MVEKGHDNNNVPYGYHRYCNDSLERMKESFIPRDKP